MTCAVPGLSAFYSLVCLDLETLDVRHSHLGSTARIQRDIPADCFWSFKLRCCRGEFVLHPGFNVQSDIFAAMIACS